MNDKHLSQSEKGGALTKGSLGVQEREKDVDKSDERGKKGRDKKHRNDKEQKSVNK